MSKTIAAQPAKVLASETLSYSDFDFDFDLDKRRIYSIDSQSLPYGFLFSPKGKGLPLIVISPHGPDRVEGGKRSFLRAQWAAKLPYNVLIWQDPTAALDEMIRSGFGLGRASHWPLENIARVVKKLRDQLAITDRNIVFAGFGGGGFASLVLASHFAGASCLLNNPDTNVVKERVQALRKIISPGYPGLAIDELARSFPERLIASEALKTASVPPRIWLLQNAREERRYLKNFLIFFLSLTSRKHEGAAGEAGHLLVDYYTDDQPGNRPARSDHWLRCLDSMAGWFSPADMPPPAAEPSAASAPIVQQRAPRERWKTLLPTEIAYWDAVISGTHPNPDTVKAFRERAGGHYPVPGSLVKLLQRQDIVRARILDVGAGPHTTIGPVLYGTRLNIVAVDPLADAYDELLERHGIEPAIRTIKGEAERLVEQFGAERFDVVYSRNALDHMRDPWIALQQMVDACVPGGVVHVEGAINEGVSHRYGGLHQWNVMPAERDMIIWNSEESDLASRVLTGVAQIKATRKDAWFSAVLVKEM